MTHHDGTELEEPLADRAPAEIGRVLSAGTNVIQGRVHSLEAGALKHKVPLRIMQGSVMGLAVGFMIGLPAEALLMSTLASGVALLAPLLAGLGLGPIVALWLGRSPRTTTFVGELGLARVTASQHVETLLFADAATVDGGAVIQRVMSAFGAASAGARLDVAWRDASGRRLFRIVGLFDERCSVPPANSFHFARSALAAWQAYRGRASGRREA